MQNLKNRVSYMETYAITRTDIWNKIQFDWDYISSNTQQSGLYVIIDANTRLGPIIHT